MGRPDPKEKPFDKARSQKGGEAYAEDRQELLMRLHIAGWIAADDDRPDGKQVSTKENVVGVLLESEFGNPPESWAEVVNWMANAGVSFNIEDEDRNEVFVEPLLIQKEPEPVPVPAFNPDSSTIPESEKKSLSLSEKVKQSSWKD